MMCLFWGHIKAKAFAYFSERNQETEIYFPYVETTALIIHAVWKTDLLCCNTALLQVFFYQLQFLNYQQIVRSDRDNKSENNMEFKR